jgi:lipopolysaccharide export LptBFGC system permease protein LptF
VVARRAGALVLVLAVPLVVGGLDRTPATRSFVVWLCSYSPQRLARGAFWTVPFSALLEAQPGKLGPDTLVPTIIFAPYLLWAGVGRSLRTFFAGHVVATLAAAAFILAGVALGSATAHRLYSMSDNGVSAGLAAAAGALAVLIWHTRARPVAAVVLGAVLLLFTYRIANENLGATLADGEHLVAIAAGAFVEIRRRATSSNAPLPSPGRLEPQPCP